MCRIQGIQWTIVWKCKPCGVFWTGLSAQQLLVADIHAPLRCRKRECNYSSLSAAVKLMYSAAHPTGCPADDTACTRYHVNRRRDQTDNNAHAFKVVRDHRTEVSAFPYELLSMHCPRHLLLLALLPASADLQVVM